MSTLKGPDVSGWQSNLNLNAITADFVIIKATEGTIYVNQSCDTHYQQAKASGKKRGIYHFANHTDAIAEADYFVDNCLGYIGDAILVLDWEGTFVNDVNWAKTWLDHVYGRTGVRPLIYMSESVARSYDWSSVYGSDYGLWVAKYWDYDIDYNYEMANAGPTPTVNWGPAGYAIWQWTSAGRLNGYNGNLDLNVFYGDTSAWDAYSRSNKATVPVGSAPTPAPSVPTIPAPTPVETVPDPTPTTPTPVDPPSDPTPVPQNPTPVEPPKQETPQKVDSPDLIAFIINLIKSLIARLKTKKDNK